MKACTLNTPFRTLTYILFFLLAGHTNMAQMRQLYLDANASNHLLKLSFYSPAVGYVAFATEVGYTSDSGRTFVKKKITMSNVDYNNYAVNLTFGFAIAGVQAFDKNNILVYGDYGLVPSILSSSDGGNTFKLIYHSQFDVNNLRTGITDMVFSSNSAIGFAVDGDRVLKTVDKGQTWTTAAISGGSYFNHVDAPDVNNIIAINDGTNGNKLLKSSDQGATWQQLTLPALTGGKIRYATLFSSTVIWLNMQDSDGKGYLYTTNNGGTTWIQKNDQFATPFYCTKMHFIDANTAYAISTQNTVLKTVDGGVFWEPLARDNDYVYLGYSFNDLQCFSSSQLWAGGGHGLLEMTTNGGGITIPVAYFKTDTTGFLDSGIVNLLNYSKSGYNYTWVVNDTAVGTSYNSQYVHDIWHTTDTVKLIVSNGSYSDTTTKYVYFPLPAIINSFTPDSAATGDWVVIRGSNFYDTKGVSFGGVPAAVYNVLDINTITAQVGAGASGTVSVTTATSKGKLAGFKFLPAPSITSFTPASGVAGSTITITGTSLNSTKEVLVGGVSAAFVVLSPTTLQVTVPSGPSGSIQVTNSGGWAVTDGFTSLPVLSAFTPTNGTFGTVMTITGTSLSDITSVTIGNTPAQSFTITSANSIRAIVADGTSGTVAIKKTGATASATGFIWHPSPFVTKISPASGPVGTTVTITGSNFDATPSKNIVYFGGAKATVISGTTTSLTVKVPVGAAFDAVSVNSNNLISYSSAPFMVTFANGGSLTDSSFVLKKSFDTSAYELSFRDMDDDGSPDIIAQSPNGIRIFKNTSTLSTIAFNDPLVIGNVYNHSYFPADFDGDGKIDLAVSAEGILGAYNSFGFTRNTSVPGSLSFDTITVQPIGQGDAIIGYGGADMDGDGKTDIVAVASWQNIVQQIWVYRNISNPGSIAFDTAKQFNVLGDFHGFMLTDIDGDNKPDIIVGNAVAFDNGFSIIKNTSTKGNVSLAPRASFAPYSLSYSGLLAVDMDGDGKSDLIMNDNNGSNVLVAKNTSNGSTFSFDRELRLVAGPNPAGIVTDDLDGDGKPDIVTNPFGYDFSIFKNTTENFSLSFSDQITYGNRNIHNATIATGDINGDGKADIISAYEHIRIYQNMVQPSPFVKSFSPTIGNVGATITITGNNFNNITAVRIGDVPVASYTVTSPTSIIAVVADGCVGAVSVSNQYGTSSLNAFVLGFPPAISSLSPLTGPIGTTLTISGKNFSTVPEENIVKFGSIAAKVQTATATTLTVEVPALGSSYLPVCVTVSGRSCYSSQVFTPTFISASKQFTGASFSPRQDYVEWGGNSHYCDVDGDGNPDLVYAVSGINKVCVALNTSQPGTISFAPKVSFSIDRAINAIKSADVDGDGKPDLIGISAGSNSVSVLLNNSTKGNVAFSDAQTFLTGVSTTNPLDIAVDDIDGDGKIDIVVANYYGTVAVFRNLSTKGQLKLDKPLAIGLVSYYSNGVVVTDLDGDQKPDLAISAGGVSVFRNISVPGTIKFDLEKRFAVGDGLGDIKAIDLDNDGKMDLALSNNDGSIETLHNECTLGSLTFTKLKNVAIKKQSFGFTTGDLNGDGLPDIVAPDYADNGYIEALRNTGSLTGDVFSNELTLPPGGYSSNATIIDLDGDGKQDIAVSSPLSFFRNMTGESTPLPVCEKGSITIDDSTTATSYKWQVDKGAGFVDLTNDTTYSGVATKHLQIQKISIALGTNQYRCVADDKAGHQYRLVITAAVVPYVGLLPEKNEYCAGDRAVITVTTTNSGDTASYQWMLDGIAVGTNDKTYITPVLQKNVQVSVFMKSSAQCALPASVQSNVLTVNVIVPAVTFSLSQTNICEGETVTFSAAAVKAGIDPVYQWMLNGQPVGTNSPDYTSNTLKTGDKIAVSIRTGLADCIAFNTMAYSDTLTMTVNKVSNPAITISGNAFVTKGSFTNITATATGVLATASYEWEDSTATHNWQAMPNGETQTIAVQPVATGDKIRCKVYSLSGCPGGSNTATSNAISFVVNQTPAGSGTIYPNPVTTVLTIDDLSPLDNWSTLVITNMSGEKEITMNIRSLTRVVVPVDGLEKGLYIVTLTNDRGDQLHLKFMKL